MAFTVENGTGLAAANSYVSVSDADDALEQDPYRKEWKGLSEQEREVALRFATKWLDRSFRWYGDPFNAGTQALGFPRTKVHAWNDEVLAGGTIPAQLEEATARMALELAKASTLKKGADDLTPDAGADGTVKSFSIETLSVDFLSGTAGEALSREYMGKRLPEIETLLNSFGIPRQQGDLVETLIR